MFPLVPATVTGAAPVAPEQCTLNEMDKCQALRNAQDPNVRRFASILNSLDANPNTWAEVYDLLVKLGANMTTK